MNEITIVQKMRDPVLFRQELSRHGVKVDTTATGNTFIMRSIRAFADLEAKNYDAKKNICTLTDIDRERAFTRFVGKIADLYNIGLNASDSEMIYMIPFGKELNIMTHYQAIQRAASRKGYRIDITPYAVVNGDTLYFQEEMQGTDRYMTVVDKRKNRDLRITPDRVLGSDYFAAFWLRLSIYKVNQKGGKDIFIRDVVHSLSPTDVVEKHARPSETAFASEWVPTGRKDAEGKLILNKHGFPESKKVVHDDKFNPASVWFKHTEIMVWKSVLRSMTWLLKESLPALAAVFEFDDTPADTAPDLLKKAETPDENAVAESVDLAAPSEEVLQRAAEINDAYQANPLLMKANADSILTAMKTQKYADIVNCFGAEILSLKGTPHCVLARLEAIK